MRVDSAPASQGVLVHGGWSLGHLALVRAASGEPPCRDSPMSLCKGVSVSWLCIRHCTGSNWGTIPCLQGFQLDSTVRLSCLTLSGLTPKVTTQWALHRDAPSDGTHCSSVIRSAGSHEMEWNQQHGTGHCAPAGLVETSNNVAAVAPDDSTQPSTSYTITCSTRSR